MTLLLLALTLTAPAPKEAPKETPSILGEWIGENGTRNGKPQPPPPGTGLVFEKDGSLVLMEGGKGPAEKGTYKTDAKKSPAELDLMPPGGGGMAMLGIYKIEGDTLTIAFSMGQTRPTEFASAVGSEIMLIICKRATKK